MADIRRTKLPVFKQTVSTSKTSTGTKKAKQTQPKTVTKTTVTKKPTVTVKKAIVPATQIKKPIEKKEQIATKLTQLAKEVKTAKTTQKATQKPASNTQKQPKTTTMKGDKITIKPRTKAERQEELKSVKRAGIEAAKELVEFGLRANEAVVNSPLRLDKLLQKAKIIQKSKQEQPSVAGMAATVIPEAIEATKPKLKTKQAEQASDIAGFVGGMFIPTPAGKGKAVEKIATKAEQTVADLLKTNPTEAIKVAREAFEAKGLKGVAPKVTAPAKERQTGRWVIKNTADKSIAKVVDTKDEAIAAVRKEANAIKAKKQAEVDANPDAVIDAVIKKYGDNPTQKQFSSVIKQMTSAKKKEIPVYIHPEYKTAETAKELTPLKNIEDAIKYKTKKQLNLHIHNY